MRNADVVAQLRSQAQGRPRRILVVEDEEDIRELVKELLESGLERVEVLTAGHGEAALALAQQGPVDLVVTDYKMPGMNGLEFLGKLRGIAPGTPAILMTAFPDLDIAIRAINEAHVQSFLQKPIEPQQVLRVAGGILSAWQKRSEEARGFTRSVEELRQKRGL